MLHSLACLTRVLIFSSNYKIFPVKIIRLRLFGRVFIGSAGPCFKFIIHLFLFVVEDCYHL